MSFLKLLYSTVLDAIFPVSPAEEEALSLDCDQAFKAFPRAVRSPMTLACSIFSYKDERVRHLIWAIKYKKSLKAAEISGGALLRILSSYSKAVPLIIIVPMPISSHRRRERGFNQCELIADAIEKMSAENFSALKSQSDGEKLDGSRIIIARDLLARTRHQSRQTLKNREERLESAEDLFRVNEKAASKLEALKISPGKESPHLLIVIDDVITTGSTIRDAIMALRNAGFERTFGMSVAH